MPLIFQDCTLILSEATDFVCSLFRPMILYCD